MTTRRTWMKLDAALVRMGRQAAPLFRQLPGQATPCPAYIQINPRSRLVDAVVDARSPRDARLALHRGTQVRVPVPPSVTGEALLRFCRSHSIQSLMRRICDGWNMTENRPGEIHGTPDDLAADALVALLDRAKRDLRAVAAHTEQLCLDWSGTSEPARQNGTTTLRPQREGPLSSSTASLRIDPDTLAMAGADTPLHYESRDSASPTASEALNSLAQSAKRNLSEEVVEHWDDVALWFASTSIRDLWPDESIEDAARNLNDEANRNGVHFKDGAESVENALLEVAAKQFRNDPGALAKHHVTTLFKLGWLSNREHSDWREEYEPER